MRRFYYFSLTKSMDLRENSFLKLEIKMPENPNSEVDVFAQRFFKELNPVGGAVAAMGDKMKRRALGAVMENQDFARQLAPRGTIQSYTLRADVANRVLDLLGLEPVKVMAMGDIYPTDDVFDELFKIRLEAAQYSNQMIREMGPAGFSYFDAEMCKGHPRAREIAVKEFSISYGFDNDPSLMKKLIQNSCILSRGGMRGIEITFSSFLNKAMRENKIPRIIAPDNTFQMFWDIIHMVNNNPRTQEHHIDTNQKDHLHLTPDDVDKFYKNNDAYTKDAMDIWYMIAIGNPSGTDPTPEQLAATCREIIKNNPEAIIVLDCAYLRTLEDQDAREVLKIVIKDPEIMDRIIFIDSYSKTHAVPQERTGVVMSANDNLFLASIASVLPEKGAKSSASPHPIEIFSHDKVTTQGSPLYHSGLVLALHDRTVNENRPLMFKEMQRLRTREVGGVFDAMNSYPHLFDDNQSHLCKPMGIYAFPKLRPGVDALDVAAELGGLGIPFNFRSGPYTRLSTGRIMEPHFSKKK